MRYKPGSKYKVLNAGEDEFVFKVGQQPYMGPYLEMSNGTFFAGRKITNELIDSDELIKKEDLELIKGRNITSHKFNILKKSYFNFLSKTKDIVATKNFPTKRDYIMGFYKRYFSKRKNELLGYKEIDKKTYESLKNKKTEYDWHLYDYGELMWILNGGANTANTKSISITERKFKGVSVIFPNVEEFYLPPSKYAPKSQKQSIDETKEKTIFNQQTENNPNRKKHAPPSDKEVKIPVLKNIQESMLKDIQEKHKQKQNQINQQKKELKILSRIEELREGSIGGGSTSGGGGGSSGGGGGGY